MMSLYCVAAVYKLVLAVSCPGPSSCAVGVNSPGPELPITTASFTAH